MTVHAVDNMGWGTKVEFQRQASLNQIHRAKKQDESLVNKADAISPDTDSDDELLNIIF